MDGELAVYKPGRLGYQEARVFQLTLRKMRRQGQVTDTLVLTEHPPTVTVGRDGGFEHILAGSGALARYGIPVYQVERGGSVTYHGPGQLLAYPVIDLGCLDLDLHRYIYLLEETAIRVLALYGIKATRLEGLRGVWAGNDKIAAVGVAVQGGVTMHGLALNVSPDPAHFRLIVPCGLAGKGVTGMARYLAAEGRPVPRLDEVTDLFQREFAAAFGYTRMVEKSMSRGRPPLTFTFSTGECHEP